MRNLNFSFYKDNSKSKIFYISLEANSNPENGFAIAYL